MPDVLSLLLSRADPAVAVLDPRAAIAEGVEFLERLIAAQEVGLPAPVEAATPEDRLRAALTDGREVTVAYSRKLDGSEGTYRLRPYEVGYHPMSGRPVLWAQVVEGSGAAPLHASDPSTGGAHTGEIHALLWDRLDLGSLAVTDRRFTPAWPLRPDSV